MRLFAKAVHHSPIAFAAADDAGATVAISIFAAARRASSQTGREHRPPLRILHMKLPQRDPMRVRDVTGPDSGSHRRMDAGTIAEMRVLIGGLRALLASGGPLHAHMVEQIDEALTSDSKFLIYLCSNELWGGSGSIADQAFVDDDGAREEFYGILVRLGELQLRTGIVNQRTDAWTDAFREWRRRR